MSEQDRHDKFYDLLEQAEEKNNQKRLCPSCGSTDCKYAIHSIEHRGFDVSIQCNECCTSEHATHPKYDAIINNWHEPVSG